MDITEAAHTLGMAEREIDDVLDSPAGPIVKTTDGQTYVIVPADHPDAEGKTGLMFLAAPHDRYIGTFPVYAQPGSEIIADALGQDAESIERDLGIDLSIFDKPELLAHARQLGVEVKDSWTSAKIIEAIQAAVPLAPPVAPVAS